MVGWSGYTTWRTVDEDFALKGGSEMPRLTTEVHAGGNYGTRGRYAGREMFAAEVTFVISFGR